MTCRLLFTPSRSFSSFSPSHVYPFVDDIRAESDIKSNDERSSFFPYNMQGISSAQPLFPSISRDVRNGFIVRTNFRAPINHILVLRAGVANLRTRIAARKWTVKFILTSRREPASAGQVTSLSSGASIARLASRASAISNVTRTTTAVMLVEGVRLRANSRDRKARKVERRSSAACTGGNVHPEAPANNSNDGGRGSPRGSFDSGKLSRIFPSASAARSRVRPSRCSAGYLALTPASAGSAREELARSSRETREVVLRSDESFSSLSTVLSVPSTTANVNIACPPRSMFFCASALGIFLFRRRTRRS